MSAVKGASKFQGKWVYRSLRNDKALNTPFNNLQFGLGVVEFKKIAGGKILNSSLDMGSNFILNLEGEITGDESGTVSLKWRGTGVAGSPTEGWIYDYQAYTAPTWRKATDKTLVLVGSVLRAVAHGTAPAGVTGTIYMVKLD